MSVKARLIATSPLLCGSVLLDAGDVFAEITFPRGEIAEFFKNRLNWSKIRVEMGDAPNPRRALSIEKHIPQAAPHLPALKMLELHTLGDLAAVNAKALQKAVGTEDAGPLIRAAKRVIAGGSAAEVRQAVLPDVDDTPAEPVQEPKAKPAKEPKADTVPAADLA